MPPSLYSHPPTKLGLEDQGRIEAIRHLHTSSGDPPQTWLVGAMATETTSGSLYVPCVNIAFWGLSSQTHWLLFQSTWVWFLAPRLQLPTTITLVIGNLMPSSVLHRQGTLVQHKERHELQGQ